VSGYSLRFANHRTVEVNGGAYRLVARRTHGRPGALGHGGPDRDANRTDGLKDRSETKSSPEVRCDRDRVVTFADSLLRQAAEGGAIAREDAEMLAREWLAISGARPCHASADGRNARGSAAHRTVRVRFAHRGRCVLANEYGGRRRERARDMRGRKARSRSP
jgi:hypothetical protein